MLKVTHLSGFGAGRRIQAGALLTLTAGVGSYAVTGTIATLTKSSLKILTAGGGSYAVTGAAATLVKPTWQTTFSAALSTDSTGWTGYNIRQIIDAASISLSGSTVRLTLQAATATSGCSIDGIYIGHPAVSGDPYDFNGSQVQIKVAASSSFTIAMGTSVVTDPVAFALDETKPLIIAVHFNTTSSVRGVSFGSCIYYFKSAANETATTDVTGYTTGGASQLRLVTKVEVLV